MARSSAKQLFLGKKLLFFRATARPRRELRYICNQPLHLAIDKLFNVMNVTKGRNSTRSNAAKDRRIISHRASD